MTGQLSIRNRAMTPQSLPAGEQKLSGKLAEWLRKSRVPSGRACN